MNESGIGEFRRQAIELWQSLGRAQRIAIIVVGALSLLTVSFLLTWARTPEYATVFSNMSEVDAASVVAKLKESKTPYELANGGTAVKVPSSLLYETRLQLASAGLPQGGGVGFELFNQTNFGMTDFAQKVNYQRALEGELGRTINHLGPVEQSRVHIVIPQPSLYSDNQKETTASVVLKLRPGQKLKDGQIKGIGQLVSSSVEGLKLENITIVDANGAILSEILASSRDGQHISSTQLEGQRAFETDLEQRVQGMLDRVLGPGKATVRVRAMLDWDRFETSSETYSPTNAQPQVRSSRESYESYGALPPGAGGVPGAQSNLPGYSSVVTATRGVTGTSSVTSTAGQNNQYVKRDLTNNYELSKLVEKTTRAPGAIKRLSVAVVLDSAGQEIPPEQIEDVNKLVVAAAGMDTARGDVLAVSSIPYNKDGIANDVKAMEEARRWETYLQAGKILAMAIGPVLLLLLLLMATRRGRARQYEPVRGLPMGRGDGTMAELNAAQAAATLQDNDDLMLALAARQAAPAAPVKSMIVEDPQRKMVREQVAALAQAQPEVLASLIKTWMQEGAK